MSTIIESPQISLLTASPEDIPFLQELEQQSENSRFVIPYTPQHHLACIQNPDLQYLLIAEHASEKIVGFVLLAGLSQPDRTLEFRRIIISQKGRGLGRESISLIQHYCFEELGHHRLWLDVFEDNSRAIHLYESLGFVKEGLLREAIQTGNAVRSLLVYAMLAPEYREFKQRNGFQQVLAQRGEYLISTDPKRLDLKVIHAYLSQSYWAPGIPLTTVQKSIEGSMAFGIYHQSQQVGFARVLTDHATFAYLADVFILPEHQGKGLGKWLMKNMLSHPKLQGLRRWSLGTLDAHGLYAQFGFTPMQQPERFMELTYPNIYKDSSAE